MLQFIHFVFVLQAYKLDFCIVRNIQGSNETELIGIY